MTYTIRELLAPPELRAIEARVQIIPQPVLAAREALAFSILNDPTTSPKLRAIAQAMRAEDAARAREGGAR